MSEDRDVWDELLPTGFLHGLREAHREATLAVFRALSRGAGFKDRSYGYTSYDVLESQIDRVFDGDPAVTRDNLNNSPGWRRGRYRVLLKRHEFGAVRSIRWDRDSRTKQLVARQAFDDDPQLLLDFDVDPPGVADSGTVTLVLAHSASEKPLELELFLGRPRMNTGGGDPWHWLLELSEDALGPDPRRRRPAEPTLPLWAGIGGEGTRTAPDADVPMRLRGRRARPLDEKAQ